MTTTPADIAAFAGSQRAASWARALLRAAAELRPADARLTVWDGLGEVPLFNEDLERGPTPEAVADLRGLIERCDALLIAIPEFNMAIPGVLKNVLDWASGIRTDRPREQGRRGGGHEPPVPSRLKTAGVVGRPVHQGGGFEGSVIGAATRR